MYFLLKKTGRILNKDESSFCKKELAFGLADEETHEKKVALQIM